MSAHTPENDARDWALWCPLPGHDGTHRHGSTTCPIPPVVGQP